VSAEGVATVPQCKECGAVWLPGDSERWHCFVVDDGPQDRLVFYCPECAEREFGDLGEE
jgi:RNase P subunit RPR2